MWFLTTPPHLKHVAALPCNLPLTACFADINVSQGSVATYARCDGIFLLRNLPVKNVVNRLRFDRTTVMSLWPRFFRPPCIILINHHCTLCYVGPIRNEKRSLNTANSRTNKPLPIGRSRRPGEGNRGPGSATGSRTLSS